MSFYLIGLFLPFFCFLSLYFVSVYFVRGVEFGWLYHSSNILYDFEYFVNKKIQSLFINNLVVWFFEFFFFFSCNFLKILYFFICSCLFLSFFFFFFLLIFSLNLSIFLLYFSDVFFFSSWCWISVNSFYLFWGFSFDFLTLVMLCVVSFISFFVHLFSFEYMFFDPQKIRFFSLLSLFTWTMLILLSADNLIQLFFGWEAVGICSYLLINFWHTRLFANLSSLKAILINRIGDFGLFVSILCCFVKYKTVKFSLLFSILSSSFFLSDFFSFSFCFFLLIAAFGKSAQLFLHTWLPDAMEGPTPVSALIHAATMVTAGVFLIMRFSCLFEHFSVCLVLLSFFSSLTAFFSASCGLFQNDIKKIIAYSTCSQLGFMFFCCSLSAYHIALFHLVTHAFFKALLFLSAGSIIHAVNGEQDIRRMGGLFFLLPITFFFFLIGNFALIGFPFFSGFFSKDLILEVGLFGYWIYHSFFFILLFFALLGTTVYSYRLFFLVFLQKPMGSFMTYSFLHETVSFMFVSLFFLMLGSVFFGFLFFDFFCGFGLFYQNSFYFSPFFFVFPFIEFVTLFFKNLPLFCLIMLFFIFFFFSFFYRSLFYFFIKFLFSFYFFFKFFSKKWYFDSFFNKQILSFFAMLSFDFFFCKIDRGLFELCGPFGLILTLLQFSKEILYKNTGELLDYFLSFFIFLVFFFLFFFLI